MTTENLETFNRDTIIRRSNEITAKSNEWDEVAKQQKEPTIIIVSNGSRWAGEEPASFNELLEVLERAPLRPSQAPFIDERPISCQTEKPFLPEGWTMFSGNFYLLSHVFSIVTNDNVAIHELTKSIEKNMASKEYANAESDVFNR